MVSASFSWLVKVIADLNCGQQQMQYVYHLLSSINTAVPVAAYLDQLAIRLEGLFNLQCQVHYGKAISNREY